MNKILTIVTLFVLVVPVIWGQDSVIDIDGNVYETVQIGEQLWMKENLKVTHYRNGDEIPTGYSDAVWENLTTGGSISFDVLDIQDLDEIIIPGTIYGFNNGAYIITESIEPGKGYWIKTNGSGSIILIEN